MQPFLAMIMPVGGGSGNYPDQGLPPGQGGVPTHPIYMPPYPSQGLPPFPAHPIAPGGGGQPPRPDQGLPPFPSQGLPGWQPYPDQGLPGGQGGRPSHPIYYPPYPDQGLPPFPSQGLPGQQPRPDQGLPPFPSHPITLPPELPETLPDPDNRPIDWKTAWTPATGWVVVGIPTGPVPTPSGQQKF